MDVSHINQITQIYVYSCFLFCFTFYIFLRNENNKKNLIKTQETPITNELYVHLLDMVTQSYKPKCDGDKFYKKQRVVSPNQIYIISFGMEGFGKIVVESY